MDKQKIKKFVIDKSNKTLYCLKKIYNQTLDELFYIYEAKMFNVYKTKEKENINKPFLAFLDDNSKTLFVNTKNVNRKKKYLNEGSYIKDGNGNTYEVVKVDYEVPCEYLYKHKNKYQSINCYKIYLK